MNLKRTWQDFKLISLINWYSFVNGMVYMVRRIPILGRALGDSYALRPFKKLSRLVTPLVLLVMDLVKVLLSSCICVALSYLMLTILQDNIAIFAPPAGMDPFRLCIRMGIFLIVYLFLTWGSSQVVDNGNTLYEWLRYFHLDIHRSVMVMALFRPAQHFVSRCIVWSVLFTMVWPAWNVLEVIGWSLAVYLLDQAFARHNYQKKLKEKENNTASQWASAFLRLFVNIAIIAILAYFHMDIGWFSWLLSLVLLVPAWQSMRFFLQQKEYSRLIQVSTEMYYSIESLSEVSNDNLKLNDSDLQQTNAGIFASLFRKKSSAEKEDPARGDDASASGGQNVPEAYLSEQVLHHQSDKKGYAYLNDLFFKRHARLLERPIRTRTIIGALIGFIATFAFILLNDAKVITDLIYIIPLMMYLLCSNENLTKAMYINCDQSLLHYSFYKEQEALLTMFKCRMASLWKLMQRPTLLVILFFAVNGLRVHMSPWHLMATLLLVLTYGAFFTIFPLFIYYVFQPYDEEGSHSFAPTLLSGLVYGFCFFGATRFSNIMPPMPFALVSIAFFLIFIPVAYWLVVRLGPKAMRH